MTENYIPTPASTQLMKNIENFMEKWISTECNGWRILNEHAIKEIASLKGHIQRGCLSNIPPGGGTNRNEALHRTVHIFKQAELE